MYLSPVSVLSLSWQNLVTVRLPPNAPRKEKKKKINKKKTREGEWKKKNKTKQHEWKEKKRTQIEITLKIQSHIRKEKTDSGQKIIRKRRVGTFIHQTRGGLAFPLPAQHSTPYQET